MERGSITGTPLALNSTAVDVGLAIEGAGAVTLDIATEGRRVTLRSRPRATTPLETGKALELEAFTLPLTTRLAGSVECA